MDQQLHHLGELSHVSATVDFLQVLCQSLKFRGLPNGGIRLEIVLLPSMKVVTQASEKRQLTALMDLSEGQRIEEKISAARGHETLPWQTHRFDKFLLRHASGGVLPSVGNRANPTFMLFERDIAPQGWNIANGASSNHKELTDVNALLQREAGEEILFFDAARKTIHAIANVEANAELRLAQALWSEKLKAKIGNDLEWTELPGPDTLVVTDLDGQTTTTNRLHVVVNACDFGIECVRRIHILAGENKHPLDGEILNEQLLDRRCAFFTDKKSARLGRPASLFQGGQPIPLNSNRTKALCPVTKKLLV